MNMNEIETDRMKLALESLEGTRARIDAMSDEDRVDLSAEWLSLLASATNADPWILGFNMLRREDDLVIGQCGFKGPPDSHGVVEIAYFVEPDWRGNGFATEAAEAMTKYAFKNEAVQMVRAHTLPEPNASTKVLTKAGFKHVGEVIDPEDGPVWRWEKEMPRTMANNGRETTNNTKKLGGR